MRLDTKIKLLRVALFVASVALVKIGLTPQPIADGDPIGADPQ